MARPLVALLLATSTILAACGRPAPPRLPASETSLVFAAESREAGLAPYFWSGRMRDARIIVSVAGAVAWSDYDGDGDPDLFLTQGLSRPDDPRYPEDCGRLLRNEDGRRFVDVTEASGLRSCGWGMGILWEDLDRDGRTDLFLTFAGPNELWMQRPDGTFADSSDGSGLREEAPSFDTGAAALDADRDGDLDLFVVGYIDTSVEEESALPPFRLKLLDEYEPVPDRLYLNDGTGRFEHAPGAVDAGGGRGLTVVAADLDGDDVDDLFVANDRDPNQLLKGRGDGTFEDWTLLAGVGHGLEGETQAGMGADVGDVNGDGRPDVAVSNFADEPMNLYVSLGDGVFADRSLEEGLFQPTHEPLGWAVGLPDLDLDGRLDLFVTNGHLMPGWVVRVARLRDDRPELDTLFRGPYRQSPLLFRGEEDGFRLEPAFSALEGVWRGAGAADADLDGLLDLVLYSSDSRTPTLLLRNRSPRRGGWLEVRTGPAATPRVAGIRTIDAIAGEVEVRRFGSSGGTYLGGSSLPFSFGVGPAPTATLRVRSDEGDRRYLDLPMNRRVVLGHLP